jgi:hypothetical protein
MQPRARIISEHFATSEIYNREIGRLQPRLKDGPGGCGARLCGGPEKFDRKPWSKLYRTPNYLAA